MIKVISVRFRTAGKVYFFDPLDFDIQKGQHVIVETARGVEYGLVVGGVREVTDDKVIQPLKPVLRIATPEDDLQDAKNQERKAEAFKICQEKIRKHELDMKLVEAEYTFDNNKVLFYFTADGRIDFRELVKDLAAVFKTRIELRQIGVRDEIKFMGGVGVCGRVLCCHSYLSEFVPVSIKMAKEQNLSLNPTKISGVCGRLMCCLKNEEEIYEELNRKLPNVGDYVTTQDDLKGTVHSVNVLRQLIKVIVEVGDEKEIKEYHVDDLQFKKKYHSKDKSDLSPEEQAELERLEREEKEDAEARREENKVSRDRNRKAAAEKEEVAELKQETAEEGKSGQQGKRFQKHRPDKNLNKKKDQNNNNNNKPQENRKDRPNGKKNGENKGENKGTERNRNQEGNHHEGGKNSFRRDRNKGRGRRDNRNKGNEGQS